MQRHQRLVRRVAPVIIPAVPVKAVVLTVEPDITVQAAVREQHVAQERILPLLMQRHHRLV